MDRRIKCITLCVVLLIGIISILFLFNSKRQKIENFVKSNREYMEGEIKNNNIDKLSQKYPDLSIETYEDVDNLNVVEFGYSSKGIIPASKYYGFYYSKDDTPHVFQGSALKLVKEKDGWKWTDGSDNGGFTSRISKNWFYYKAWF